MRLAAILALVPAIALGQSVVTTPDKPVQVVTGPNNGPLEVGGTVRLDESSINSIAAPTCTSGTITRISVSTVPTTLPASGALSERSSVFVQNVDAAATARLVCAPDPTTPDCATPGFGLSVYQRGGARFPLPASTALRCRACAGTVTVEIQEELCTQ